jgi:tetratricopeptide (TPR) repeat protein
VLPQGTSHLLQKVSTESPAMAGFVSTIPDRSLPRCFRHQWSSLGWMSGGLWGLSMSVANCLEETPSTPRREYDTAQWRVYTDRAKELVRQKKYDEAQKYLEKAVGHAERGFGLSDPHVASAKQNLAELYRLTKQYEKAAPLYDEALAILIDNYGTSDIRVAFALHNVAGFYLAQQKLDKAEEYYLQSLHVKLASVGPGHTETSNTMFHLSELYWMKGDKDKSIEYSGKALDALKTLGSNMTAYSRRQARMADMLIDAARLKEAEKVLLDMLDTNPEQEWQVRARSLESLGRVKMMQGEHKEARTYVDQALEVRDEYKQHYPILYSACLRLIAQLDIDSMKAPGRTAEQIKSLRIHADAVIEDAHVFAQNTLLNALDHEQPGRTSSWMPWSNQNSNDTILNHTSSKREREYAALELAYVLIQICQMHPHKAPTLAADILSTLQRQDVWSKPIPHDSTPDQFRSMSKPERQRLVIASQIYTQVADDKGIEGISDDLKRIFPHGIPSWLASHTIT